MFTIIKKIFKGSQTKVRNTRPAKIRVKVKTVNGQLTDHHQEATIKALQGPFGRTGITYEK